MNVKITLMLPKDPRAELEKRAAEEGGSVRELVIDAILRHLSSRDTLDLVLTPVESAGPESFKEFEDVSG